MAFSLLALSQILTSTTTIKSPERDFVREREDAEQAHDDALRAAERLADRGF